MPPDKDAYQRIFSSANDRLFHLTDERCKELELMHVRALRFAGPRPPMLRELVRQMDAEAPCPAFKERVHHSMRRLFVAMHKDGQPPDAFRTALNAYVDGQVELAARYLTADTLLRPWGEK